MQVLSIIVMFIGAGSILAGGGVLLYGFETVPNSHNNTFRAALISAGMLFLTIGPTLVLMGVIGQKFPTPG